MELEVHYINNRIVEVNCNLLQSGLLNKEDAKELAKNLVAVAAELLDLDE